MKYRKKLISARRNNFMRMEKIEEKESETKASEKSSKEFENGMYEQRDSYVSSR